MDLGTFSFRLFRISFTFSYLDLFIFSYSNISRVNFLPLQLRRQIFIKAKQEAEEILTKREFKFLYKEHYFPPKSTHGE
jgi:hypothetical protein